MGKILTEISEGELLDKITILEIKLNEIKNKIKLYSTKKNLFKPDKFTKNLEKSYKMIYENYLNDHNPKEIEL